MKDIIESLKRGLDSKLGVLSFVTLIVIAVLVLTGLNGCVSNPPTPFETGEEVAPPIGCIEGRTRGVDC